MDSIQPEIDSISFGTIEIDPIKFAGILQKYVFEGSKRHRLSKDDLTVFFNIDDDFEGKEDKKIQEFDGKFVAKTLEGLMAAGARFMDAVFWLSLPEAERPKPEEHDKPASGTSIKISVYNSHPEIAKCMFFYFFYILTRARAPSVATTKTPEPVPKFISKVLSIVKTESEVAEYLASFNLDNIDPSWVKHIEVSGLSQEALNRLGLGVAGYRMVSPFKLRVPDGPNVDKFSAAIKVAKSFGTSQADWAFHPSTREADVLTKYGNINQNLGNLMLEVYKQETLEELAKIKIIFKVPEKHANHTNYTRWTEDMEYKVKYPIFGKK